MQTCSLGSSSSIGRPSDPASTKVCGVWTPPLHALDQFKHQRAGKMRKLLGFMHSNCGSGARVEVNAIRQPIDMMVEATTNAIPAMVGNHANYAKNEIRLLLNTHGTMCLAPEPEFRRVLEETRWLEIAAQYLASPYSKAGHPPSI